MQRILEQINFPRVIAGTIAISVICAAAGIGTGFFTRLIIICSCGAGIAFAGFLMWETWQAKDIETYKEQTQQNPRCTNQDPRHSSPFF